MISMSVSVDVANMADGARFYTESFGFSKVSEPIPGVVVLRAGTSAGAKQEQLFENPGYPPVAFCGDPFGQADARNPRG